MTPNARRMASQRRISIGRNSQSMRSGFNNTLAEGVHGVLDQTVRGGALNPNQFYWKAALGICEAAGNGVFEYDNESD